MRTKNAKRLWPVPATLGVMALAALLAFGLMATNGAQPAAAQDDPCYEVEPDRSTTQPEVCSVTGTEAAVEFMGTDTTADQTTSYYVYYPVRENEAITLYQSGTVYLDNQDHDRDDTNDDGIADATFTDTDEAATPKVTGYYSGSPAEAPSAPTEVSGMKLGYKLIELDPEAKQGASGPEAQTDTIMVSGEAGDKKVVYVYRSAPTLPTVDKEPDDSTADITAKTLEAINSLDSMITITFLGTPAIAFDADKGAGTPAGVETIYTDNDDDVNGSTLLVTTANIARKGDLDANADGYDDRSWVIPSGTGAEASDFIMITATIMDSAGQALLAGDKDSRVDFSVVYADMSDVTDNTSDYTSRQTIMEDMSTAAVEVEGWNNGSKPVSVTISATYTGPTAPNGFDLGMITLTRAGGASMADFATYGCEMKTDAEGGKGCADQYEAMSNMRFGPGEKFSISGKFVDVLGTTVTTERPRVSVASADRDALSARKAGTGDTGFTVGADIVEIGSEADLGGYTITVNNGRSGDDKVEQMLDITVVGPADDL